MWRDHTILVGPVGGGWSVRCDDSVQPLMFFSGARAEEQARALARCLARGGETAHVVVQDRTQALVGSTRYFGREKDSAAA